MSRSDNDKEGGIGFLLWLPVLAVVLAVCCLGWFAARAKASYRVVRFLVFPVTFVLTQAVGAATFMCLGWFLALLMGNTPMANYVIGSISDLALYGSFFDKPTIPSWHIFLYQFILWLVLGRMISRALTISIYDSAIQSIGAAEGIHPYHVRERVVQTDSGYAAAYTRYQNRGGPLLGIILVGISKTPVGEYY